MKINFCRRCLYGSTHPLGILLDDHGICSGCRIHEEKDNLDWSARWEKLKTLVLGYKDKRDSPYDCIVPVTGSHDSYYIVHLVKNKLGLNPLLVSNNKFFNTPLGIRNLANLRIKFDCDLIQQNIDPNVVKKITRSTLRKFGSIYWAVHAGHSVFPVQSAIRFNVPLIIWGAHQGLEQVGMFSHANEVEMTRRYRKEHDLLGYEPEDLNSVFDTLTENDLSYYKYPTDFEINKYGVRGIYLGNYVRWDPKRQHEEMIREFGYESASFNRTFDCYDHVDCFNYLDIHDLLKLYKCGYSKVTDHATREIRFGRITRNEGLALVRAYEMKPLKYVNNFCEWMGIGERELQFVIDQHRNPLFWIKTNLNEWQFNGWSAQNYEFQGSSEANSSQIKFEKNSSLERGCSNAYVTVGKGYP